MIRLRRKIAADLPCPLVFDSTGYFKDYKHKLSMNALDSAIIATGTKIRLLAQINDGRNLECNEGPGRILLTHEDVNDGLHTRNEGGEDRVIALPTWQPSVAAAIFSHIQLNRTVTKNALAQLS